MGFQRVVCLIPHSFKSQQLVPFSYHCLWDGLRFQFFPSSQVSSPVIPTFKDPPANAGDEEDPDSISGLGRSSGGGSGNLFQYSGLENPMDRGAWQAATHGVTKSWDDRATEHACTRNV